MLTIQVGERELQLATNLRVAFKVQGQHNHKPYMEIFREMSGMKLENQIKILYAAYQVQNGESAMTETEFMNMMFDNFNLADLMILLGDLVNGIMYNGLTSEQIEEKKSILAKTTEAM